MRKKRSLLEMVIERGFAKSEREAISIIMQGNILVDGRVITQVNSRFDEESKILLRRNVPKYVSRGGLKLANFLEELGDYAPKIRGKVCLDIGCGTGGFTQVLLERGAKKVYAVDVGKNVLHESLRQDSRVVFLKGVNARFLSAKDVPEPISIFTIDVSFISGASLLSAVSKLRFHPSTHPKVQGILLLKPQFERTYDKKDERTGEFRKGVIRSKRIVLEAIKSAYAKIVASGFAVLEIALAQPRGYKGNYEFFLLLGLEAEKSFSAGASDEGRLTFLSDSQFFAKAREIVDVLDLP